MTVPLYGSMADAATVLLRDAVGREVVALLDRQKQASASAHAAAAGLGNPIIVLEGMDGTGKSTLARNLAAELGAGLLRTPPEALRPFRAHFDAQEEDLRRAYYTAGNYACAMEAAEMAAKGPVVIDRFWPSTAAYAIAGACDTLPQILQQPPEMLRMPRDLVALLPAGCPVVGLLLVLEDEELRARRVRERAAAGPPMAAVPVTGEEEALERDPALRERVLFAYRKLRLDCAPLRELDAAGMEQEVLQGALALVDQAREEAKRLVPVSVNWHYTRVCNYQCKFCFHTAKNSFFLPRDHPEGMAEAKRCLRRLKEAGMKKINFSGGEPFLHPKELGELCRFCKGELRLESVSIISNGSKITERWVREYASCVDILAVSCDSFNEETNKKVGRGTGMHIAKLKQVATWCRQYGVLFKMNSVINTHNVDEDMNAAIAELGPVRWKVFQCLILAGENAGDQDALRDARELVISDEQFKAFLERHRGLPCLVEEDNKKMKDSYLILDEHMRFLNCTDGSKKPGESLCDVSVIGAMRGAGFDAKMFERRGGIYAWGRPRPDIEDIAVAQVPTPSGRSRSPGRRGGQAPAGTHAPPGGDKLPSPWDGGAAGAAAAAAAAVVVVVAGAMVAAQLFRPRRAAWV